MSITKNIVMHREYKGGLAMKFIASLMMISALACPIVIIFLSIKLKKVTQELRACQVQDTQNLQSLLNGGENE